MFREEVAEHYRTHGYTIREDAKVRGASGTVHRCDMVAQSPLGNLVIAFEDASGFEGPEMNAVRRIARDIGATPVVAARTMPPGVQRFAARAGVVLIDEARLRQPQPTDPEPEDESPAYPPWPGSGADDEAGDGPAPWPATGRARPRASGPLQTEDVDALVHEWSETSRPVARTKSTDPGFWSYPRGEEGTDGGEGARGQGDAFSWLGPAASERAAQVPSEGTGARTARPQAVQAPPSQRYAPGETRAFSEPRASREPHPSPEPRVPLERAQPLEIDPVAARAHARPPGTAQESHGSSTRPAGLRLWHWFALAVTFGATAGGVFYALWTLFG